MNRALQGGLIGVVGGVGEVHGDIGGADILVGEVLRIEVFGVLRFGFGFDFWKMKKSGMADGGERKGENSKEGAQFVVKLTCN